MIEAETELELEELKNRNLKRRLAQSQVGTFLEYRYLPLE